MNQTADPVEPRANARRVAALCVLAFVVMATYAIARPTSESLFIGEHGAESLPWVWLAVGATALVVVTLYNRYSAGYQLARVFGVISVLSAGLLALIVVLRQAGLPGSTYALYIWKDTYIVVLVEIFWSIANSAFPIRTARWTYGLFCAMGALGGMVSNFTVGKIAAYIGTSNTVWIVPPVLTALGIFAWVFASTIALDQRKESKVAASFSAGFEVVRKSRYLVLMLLLIVAVQIVITLIDYEYSRFLEVTYPDTDRRTEIIGFVYGAIDIGSFSLQMLTGVILKVLGVPATLLAIPFVLAASLFSFAVSAKFITIAIAKVASKALDYSLFRAAKEILYIPLGYDEKTQGKAVVDMLTYRVAKGVASVILLTLTALAAGGVVTWLALGLTAVWGALTLAIVRSYRNRVGSDVSENQA